MNELLTLIGNVGFPMAVAAYLLIRIENRLTDLTCVINDLREAVITVPSGSGWPGCRLSALNTRTEDSHPLANN